MDNKKFAFSFVGLVSATLTVYLRSTKHLIKLLLPKIFLIQKTEKSITGDSVISPIMYLAKENRFFLSMT